jgi:hypothetical protein
MKSHFVVATLALGLSLASQSQGGGTTPPVPAPAPAPTPAVELVKDQTIERRAALMRDQIENGRPIYSHVRVAVRLKNGNKLLGVVKDGKLVERVDGLRFVEANAQDRGAGIRLWYTGGTRNYVFVPFRDLSEYEVLQRLSDKQITQIETDMQMNERRAAERAAAAARAANGGVQGGETPPAEPPAAQTPPAPTGESAPPVTNVDPGVTPAMPATVDAKGKVVAGKGEDPVAAKAKAQQDQQRVWFALVQDYAPAKGWGKAKRDEIARRKAVVGAMPSESELRFVEMYAEWLKACAHFGIDTAPKPATGEGEGAGEGEAAEGEQQESRSRRRKQK